MNGAPAMVIKVPCFRFGKACAAMRDAWLAAGAVW